MCSLIVPVQNTYILLIVTLDNLANSICYSILNSLNAGNLFTSYKLARSLAPDPAFFDTLKRVSNRQLLVSNL